MKFLITLLFSFQFAMAQSEEATQDQHQPTEKQRATIQKLQGYGTMDMKQFDHLKNEPQKNNSGLQLQATCTTASGDKVFSNDARYRECMDAVRADATLKKNMGTPSGQTSH